MEVMRCCIFYGFLGLSFFSASNTIHPDMTSEPVWLFRVLVLTAAGPIVTDFPIECDPHIPHLR